MKLQQPLQVYLDSSDYSDLSNPKLRDEHEGIERQLLSWRDAGLIEIRFSFAHVAEMAPIAPAHIEHARRRAACIKRLCNDKTLLQEGEIASREIEAWASKVPLARTELRRDDGVWMPTMDPADLEMPPIDQLLREAFEGIPKNRAARRRMRGSYEQLLPQMLKTMPDLLPQLCREFGRQFPMSDAAVDALRDYLRGDSEKVVLQQLLLHSCKDLRLFVDWYALNWSQVTQVTEWIRNSGQKLFEDLSGRRSAIEALFEARRNAGATDEQITADAMTMMKKLPRKLLASSMERLGGLSETHDAIDVAAAFALMPGLTTSAHHLVAVFSKTLTQTKRPRMPKASDFGDMIHAVYLPYVDFFRIDGFAAPELKAMKLPFDTEVVGKLVELPPAIESRLAGNH